jgi:hypothetical protein
MLSRFATTTTPYLLDFYKGWTHLLCNEITTIAIQQVEVFIYKDVIKLTLSTELEHLVDDFLGLRGMLTELCGQFDFIKLTRGEYLYFGSFHFIHLMII